MLIAHVTVPKKWTIGKAIDLKADESWLNCKDLCLPGKAKLELSVAVGDARNPDNAEEFTRWKARLPVEAKEAEAVVKVSGAVNDLTLIWQKPVKAVEVLPVPPTKWKWLPSRRGKPTKKPTSSRSCDCWAAKKSPVRHWGYW